MKSRLRIALAGVLSLGLVATLGSGVPATAAPPATPPQSAPQPSLNVEPVRPVRRTLPLILSANGSISAWQEAVIGAEIGGQRLTGIHAQIGDQVKKGQVLAVFDRERITVDVAQSQATLAEAEANLQEARLNAQRVRQVVEDGALSAQQVGQYLTGEKTAEARMQLARAQLDQQQLRLSHTQVIANDDGVISSRSATLGAVVTEGQELFRLVRQNRLEWRAEVTTAELPSLKPGLLTRVEVPDIGRITGKVRSIGPTLDAQSRNALVYVDLPNASAAGFKPGMFARGEFQYGTRSALTIPQSALSLREGFSYVFRIGAAAPDGLAKVTQVKVTVGRSEGDRVEIMNGLTENDRLVASGAAFLSDGDTVRVVQ